MARPIFRSQNARARLFVEYDQLLTRWPVPHRSLFVQTSFGVTHVIKSGPERGPALILLHPHHSNSALWIGNIAALARDRRVFAVDIIGDAGKSEPDDDLPFGFDRPWLLQIMDSLFIDHVDIVAVSRACQIAINLAAYVPDRIDHLVLVSASLNGMQPRRELARHLRRTRRRPTARNARQLLALTAPTLAPDHDLLEYQAVVLQSARQPNYPVYQIDPHDGDRFVVSTLLLHGEREVMFDVEKARRIGRTILARMEAETVPEVGHLMTIERPLLISDRITRFLRG